MSPVDVAHSSFAPLIGRFGGTEMGYGWNMIVIGRGDESGGDPYHVNLWSNLVNSAEEALTPLFLGGTNCVVAEMQTNNPVPRCGRRRAQQDKVGGHDPSAALSGAGHPRPRRAHERSQCVHSVPQLAADVRLPQQPRCETARLS